MVLLKLFDLIQLTTYPSIYWLSPLCWTCNHSIAMHSQWFQHPLACHLRPSPTWGILKGSPLDRGSHHCQSSARPKPHIRKPTSKDQNEKSTQLHILRHTFVKMKEQEQPTKYKFMNAQTPGRHFTCHWFCSLNVAGMLVIIYHIQQVFYKDVAELVTSCM